MKSNFGKAAIIAILLIAIVAIINLKQQKAAETPPQNIAAQGSTAAAPETIPDTQTVPVKIQPEKKAAKNTTTELKSTGNPKIATPPAQKKVTPAVKVQKEAAPTAKAASLPRFLELGSDTCQPCQMMQPVLADLRAEYAGKLQVDFIDIYQDKTASEKYNVQFIPTQVFFDAEGKEISRHTGFYPKVKILEKFKELNIKL